MIGEEGSPTVGQAGTTASSASGLDSFGGEIGRGQARTIRARWELQTVTRIRQAVALDLAARGVDEEIVGEAELVTTELVTNSLRHATPLADRTVRIHWKARGNSVEIEVSDGGSDTQPVPAARAVWATSGRGLRIVRSIAHEWGVQRDEKQTTVWAALGGPSRRRVGH
ncbi:ATP-binding protein [Janibacter cremeus]|uniref:ATP-binding protein n=1 Tax=Janibacter cremeus TaxID=1285192 RepID=UPI0023F75ABE|nr:ATP-binding protein [Janibacter cremeus]WEV77474.1 ATP-binding protein [Janibacter cremeus]